MSRQLQPHTSIVEKILVFFENSKALSKAFMYKRLVSIVVIVSMKSCYLEICLPHLNKNYSNTKMICTETCKVKQIIHIKIQYITIVNCIIPIKCI